MSYIVREKNTKAHIAHPLAIWIMHAICKEWSAAPCCISHMKSRLPNHMSLPIFEDLYILRQSLGEVGGSTARTSGMAPALLRTCSSHRSSSPPLNLPFSCSYHEAMRTVSAGIVISVCRLVQARAALSDYSLALAASFNSSILLMV